MSANPATKNAASATPSSRRSTTTTASDPASAVSPTPSAHSSAPASITGRRPTRSDQRPTKGRQTSAVIANDPTASPAPASSEPIGPVTNSGSASRVTPTQVKYARSASPSSTNAGVSSRATTGSGVPLMGRNLGPRPRPHGARGPTAMRAVGPLPQAVRSSVTPTRGRSARPGCVAPGTHSAQTFARSGAGGDVAGVAAELARSSRRGDRPSGCWCSSPCDPGTTRTPGCCCRSGCSSRPTVCTPPEMAVSVCSLQATVATAPGVGVAHVVEGHRVVGVERGCPCRPCRPCRRCRWCRRCRRAGRALDAREHAVLELRLADALRRQVALGDGVAGDVVAGDQLGGDGAAGAADGERDRRDEDDGAGLEVAVHVLGSPWSCETGGHHRPPAAPERTPGGP